jgi:galactofuranose transport system substrate-binding protein
VWKRTLAVMSAGALALTAAACGSDDDAGGAGGTGGDEILIGFSQVGAESAWRTANTNSVQQAAEDHPRIELRFSDAQQQQENQIAAIRDFIQVGVDVIVLAPVVETGWDDVLNEARDADIPVVLADRAIETDDDGLYVTYLGSDFVEEGRNAGRWTIEEFADHDGPLRIAELEGTVGSAPANDRHDGFFEVLDSEDYDYEVVAAQSGDFTRDGGKTVMEAFLQSEGDNIDLLYAHNDDMGLGAIQAMEEVGVAPGEDIQIIIVDGSKEGFEAAVAGKVNLIVECNPLFGPQLMDLIEQVHEGQPVDKYIPVDEGVWTQEEAADEVDNRQF